MNCGLTFKIGLAAVLLTSLSFKMLFHEGKDPRQPAKLNRALAALFTAEHFDTQPPDSDKIVFLAATRDRCRVQITEADAFGAGADATQAFTIDHGDVRYVFRGAMYPKQPILAGAASYLLNAVRKQVFLSYAWEPVLLVGASPTCSLEAMAWHDVASF